MRYISSSIAQFIIGEIKRLLDDPALEAREIRIVMPSLPANVVLQVGKAVEEYRLHEAMNGHRIGFIYKSAFALGAKWETSTEELERSAGEQIRQNGWYDAENHLTQWRNVQREAQKEEILATVLVGVDLVTDKAGLADFFQLDHKALWTRILGRSFKPWLENCLKEKPIEYEEDDLSRMDELLRGLLDASLADLTAISGFLEKLDLSHAIAGRDALDALVTQLTHFRLPCMTGLRRRGKRSKTIAHYLGQAVEFFNYGRFLDERSRKKAFDRIDKFLDGVEKDNFDTDNLGSYAKAGADINETLAAFEEGLKRYISSNDAEEREKLYSVDFVFLLDEVLEKKIERQKNGPKPKKLIGMPLEVVLQAVWFTLDEFKSKMAELNRVAAEELTGIEIHGDLFKHDCEGANADESASNARQYLERIIGGLDNYLEDRLAFVPDRVNAPDRTITIRSRLCPPINEDILRFERTKSKEPYFKFVVMVAGVSRTVKRDFIWRFPQFHPYRTMAEMFAWFSESADKSRLPVFSLPFFEELMLAKDEEEVNRILQAALQDARLPKVYDLLEAKDIDHSDKAFPLLTQLAYEYARFILAAHEKGIFAALDNFPALETAFREAYSVFLNDPECAYSQLGPLFFKAFGVLGEQEESGGNYWMWKGFEPSMVITPLHPALLELLYHQHAYLCESFVVATRKGLRESGPRWFTERRWADIEDLAQIQWPLLGTLKNEEQVLDTNTHGFGLIHLIGESPKQEAALTTRLLLRYDSDEDDVITDEDLFRETRESQLIQRVLGDYWALNPHADDGISIAAYCSSGIQSLISGIHAFLTGVFANRSQDRPYTLALTLFAESQDDTTIARWVREWRERWEAAGNGGKLEYYRSCRISVAHRMITRESNYAQFLALLNQTDVDISFLFQFIRAGAGGNRFVKTEPYDHTGNYRMFPVLEKMCCSVVGGGYEFTRERIISNRQFKLGTLHSGVMARLKGITDSGNNEYVVMGRGDFSPWVRVVDELHRRSAWVVCVDPSVDERLIAKEDANGKRLREVIGFGSGVGAHGEYNYTISTEEYSLATVKRRIAAHVAAKLGPWDAETCDHMAESIIRESVHMAGLSLVKATGPSDYVRDFIAYALVRKLLPRNPAVFCDEVISLDAFRHWFDSAPNGKRPDLLRLRAVIEDGSFMIDAQLIECKLAQQSERHLEKAREQLENGLKHLMACFKPRQPDTLEGLDDRPDQRYWWLQLHRLVASKGQVSHPALARTVAALERMSDGLYTIQWSAAAVTFWTDSERADLIKGDPWEFQFEGFSMPIHLFSAGRQFVPALCAGDKRQELPIKTDRGIPFSAVKPEQVPEHTQSAQSELHVGSAPASDTGKDVVGGNVIGLSTEGNAGDSSLISQPQRIPDRIFLGSGVMSGFEAYWEFGHPELANRHMLIFGTSGMGKTYTIQALLCELGRHGQNALIVDYTDGFHQQQLESETREFLKPEQHVVKRSKVPINPFRRQEEMLGDSLSPEDPADTAQRITGVFSEVYGLGEQQWSALYNASKRGVERYGESMSLQYVPELLREVADDNVAVAASATSVAAKIQPFVDMNPFGQEDPESWEKLFADPVSRCHILQMAGYLKDAAKLITEFSLIDLYWYYRTRGKKDRPKVIVLDEIQNLDQRLESPLGKFLTEGRKFGISLILATQTLSNFQKDERDRLFQAAHKLFFRPTEVEVKSYAQILENATLDKADIWVQRLSSLKKGECYSLGPCLNAQTGALETKAIKIRIASLPSRFQAQSSPGVMSQSHAAAH